MVIVKSQKPLEFSNSCGCLFDAIELEDAILWYCDKPVARLKKVFMHGAYPSVSIHGDKIHVHRLNGMYRAGRKLESSEIVHHRNENKLDCSEGNLQVISGSQHGHLHNSGRKFSDEHRRKISEANSRRVNPMKGRKLVHIPVDEMHRLFNQGWTVNKLSKYFGVDHSTIKNRLHENPDLLKQ